MPAKGKKKEHALTPREGDQSRHSRQRLDDWDDEEDYSAFFARKPHCFESGACFDERGQLTHCEASLVVYTSAQWDDFVRHTKTDWKLCRCHLCYPHDIYCACKICESVRALRAWRADPRQPCSFGRLIRAPMQSPDICACVDCMGMLKKRQEHGISSLRP